MLAIVTGASRGIGLETVKELSRNSHIMVLAVSRDTKGLEKMIQQQQLFNVLAVKADISTAAGIQSIVKLVLRLDQSVQLLINNAGALVNKPFSKIKPAELQAVYHTNVFSPFLLIQALLPHFTRKGNAHIVNIGSMGGVQGSAKFSGLSAYSSSKGALACLSECLAEELKPEKISVNCLAIGSVQTEMLARAFPGFKAPLSPAQMGVYISEFALKGHVYYNGKTLPVSSTTP
jgi:3-oxoacyl-[acyl-carrier protein] reductase